jgi:hypothetical protein
MGCAMVVVEGSEDHRRSPAENFEVDGIVRVCELMLIDAAGKDIVRELE